jgi:hypothetical protein
VAGIAATVIATRIVWHFLNPFRKEEEKAEANHAWLISKLGDEFEEQLEETNQYEDQIAAGLVVPQDMTVRFSAGLEELKQSIRELVILPFQRPDLFRPGSLVGPPKGVLLYGPPGTGKTMLAKVPAAPTTGLTRGRTQGLWRAVPYVEPAHCPTRSNAPRLAVLPGDRQGDLRLSFHQRVPLDASVPVVWRVSKPRQSYLLPGAETRPVHHIHR